MSDSVKGGPYKPSRRADQARATRRRIIDTAQALFLEQGYAGTTMEQIAATADVAVQTVYFHFTNKRTLLKEVVDISAVGDDAPVPLLERPWIEQVKAAPDGRAAVATWVRYSAVIFERVAPIMAIVRNAAGSDADMAAQWQVNQQQRLTAHRMLAQQLADRHQLRADLSVNEAADIIFALVSLELYILLTAELSWTPDRWQRWTTTTLADSVLADDTVTSGHR